MLNLIDLPMVKNGNKEFLNQNLSGFFPIGNPNHSKS